MPKEPLRQELLTAAEVRLLLGMEETAFRDFLRANPTFPRPKVVGKTKKGREIKRFMRRQVDAYLELLGGQ